MKLAILLVFCGALFHSVVGLTVSTENDLIGFITRDENIQTTSNSAESNLPKNTAGSGVTARALRAQSNETTKLCKKGKKGKRGNREDKCLPTKDEIKAKWKANPKFNPSKLFFYSSPPGADVAEQFASKYYPGYMLMMNSFEPVKWADTWAFSDDENLVSDFWKLASEAFAEMATGIIYVLLPDGDKQSFNWPKKSNWNYELRILMASPAVTKIIRINENPPHRKSYMKGSA